MLHTHLRHDVCWLGRGTSRGEREGPGVDHLCSVRVDDFDGLAGLKVCCNAMAGGNGGEWGGHCEEPILTLGFVFWDFGRLAK